MNAVLLPGFNGAANQPILLKVEKRLKPLGISCARRALTQGKPSEGLVREIAQLAGFAKGAQSLVLIGRSFGGRVCARYALTHSVAAMVLLGFPLRPPGKRRPEDEATLAAVTCPTLIVQGDDDELGPLKTFRPILKKNPALSLHVVRGAGHSFGRYENAALDAAAQWLSELQNKYV